MGSLGGVCALALLAQPEATGGGGLLPPAGVPSQEMGDYWLYETPPGFGLPHFAAALHFEGNWRLVTCWGLVIGGRRGDADERLLRVRVRALCVLRSALSEISHTHIK